MPRTKGFIHQQIQKLEGHRVAHLRGRFWGNDEGEVAWVSVDWWAPECETRHIPYEERMGGPRIEGWYKDPPLRVEYIVPSLAPNGRFMRTVLLLNLANTPPMCMPDTKRWDASAPHYEVWVKRHEVVSKRRSELTGRFVEQVETIDAGYCPEMKTWVVFKIPREVQP